MQTIDDYSKGPPTIEEAALIQELLKTESDRGLALIAAAQAEMGLEWALARRMPDVGTDVYKATFESANAPLKTFSQKIKMGRAVGIYGPKTERLFDALRTIRNHFAHTMRPIDFATPPIAEACNRLSIPGGLKPLPEQDTPRTRYRLASMWLFDAMMRDAVIQREGVQILLP